MGELTSNLQFIRLKVSSNCARQKKFIWSLGKKIITQNVSTTKGKNLGKNRLFKISLLLRFLDLRLFLWGLLKHFHSLLLLWGSSKVIFLYLAWVHRARFFTGTFGKALNRRTKQCSWAPTLGILLSMDEGTTTRKFSSKYAFGLFHATLNLVHNHPSHPVY